MYDIKGELDLYLLDKNGKVIKHHQQHNYDTIRGRLNPSFSLNVNRITRFECDLSHTFPIRVLFDELSIIPLYPEEPIFVVNQITPVVSSDGFYAISYNSGTTWWIHDGADWSTVTFASAAELRNVGMTGSELTAIPYSLHVDKYIDHVMIAGTPDVANSVLSGYSLNLKYDSSLLDPYYVRWLGDVSTASYLSSGGGRYTLEGDPIGSQTANVYQINVNNTSGTGPINIDSIYTTTTSGGYIGTFTYVGLSVEIDQILVGTYTITVSSSTAVFTQRTDNAEFMFWGTTTPTYNDTVCGGLQYTGETMATFLNTYQGGPAADKLMGYFKPDASLRSISLLRGVGMPYSVAYLFSHNKVDPAYNLLSTGSIDLGSTDPDFRSGLGFYPRYLRYIFDTSGTADTATYMLAYQTRPDSLLNDSRLYNTRYVATAYHKYDNKLLKDPFNPVPWGYILYNGLTYEGDYIPYHSTNPFHDLLIETHQDHINIRRYGRPVSLRIEANNNETFAYGWATYEDQSNRDLHIISYDTVSSDWRLSSLPVRITRDLVHKDIDITVTGDMTERIYLSNISSHIPNFVGGLGLYDMLRVQDAKNGPWTTADLMTEIKSAYQNYPFMALANDEYSPQSFDDIWDDANNKVLDQEWGYRNLETLGDISVSTDIDGDMVIEFNGGISYLRDDLGSSGRSMPYSRLAPMSSLYLEFKPDSLQDSTLLTSRGTKINLALDGQFSVDPGTELGSSGLMISDPVTISTSLITSYTTRNRVRHSIPYIHPVNNKTYVMAHEYNGNSGDTIDVLLIDVEADTKLIIGSYSYLDCSTWSEPYWDSQANEMRIARIPVIAGYIRLETYNLENGSLVDTVDYVLNPSFTPKTLLSSTYTDDVSGHPTLVIFSGVGWTLARGVFIVDLITRTVTHINDCTGDFFPAVTDTVRVDYNFYFGYTSPYGQGNTYKDENNDLITLMHRFPWEPATSTWNPIYKFNHTTHVWTKLADTGPNLDLAELDIVWEGGLWPSRGFNSIVIPGTRLLVLFVMPLYTDSTYGDPIVNLYDIDKNKWLTPYGITRYGGLNQNIASNPYSNRLLWHPHGSSLRNNPISTEVKFASISMGNTLVYTEQTLILSGWNKSYVLPSLSYSASSVNSLGLVEFPGFKLGSMNGVPFLSGTDQLWSDYHQFSRSATEDHQLENLALGCSLDYNTGSTSLIGSYTYTDVYLGTMKNLALRTQVPVEGSYKFAPYMFELNHVSEIETQFTNTTTFVMVLRRPDLTIGTYFLDSNNGNELTLITDLNLASVTPATVTTINDRLTHIKSLYPSNTDIGFVYYNINGDTPGSCKVSKTYVKYDCVIKPGLLATQDQNSGRTSARFVSHNGRALIYTINGTSIHDQLSETVVTLYNDVSSTYNTFNHSLDTVQANGFSMVLADTASKTSPYCYNAGALMVTGSDDHFYLFGLRDDVCASTSSFPRYLMSSDIWTGEYEFIYSHISGTDSSCTVAFKINGNDTIRALYVPLYSGVLDGVTKNNCFWPLALDGETFKTSYPYPTDAPVSFTHQASGTVSDQWGSLSWTFIDGATGTSFVTNEMISFITMDLLGYAVDNWQNLNTFTYLMKGETDTAKMIGIDDNSSADGSTISLPVRAGIIDKVSSGIVEPAETDKFFIIF